MGVVGGVVGGVVWLWCECSECCVESWASGCCGVVVVWL